MRGSRTRKYMEDPGLARGGSLKTSAPTSATTRGSTSRSMWMGVSLNA